MPRKSEPNIEVKDDGNIHVDGTWLTDIDADTAWLRAEAARFNAVADFLDSRRALDQPVWNEADKYAADKYA